MVEVLRVVIPSLFFCSDNLEWISKAINWNKFNAVATIGLIHRVRTCIRDHSTAFSKLGGVSVW